MTPERLARLRKVLDQRQPDLVMVTDFVHKQRNLSAIVRNCDAVGIMRVFAAIGDEDYRAFRGTTMGSHRWVTVTPSSDLDEALTPLEEQGLQTVAAHLDASAVDYREVDYTRPTAIVMGAERAGLDRECLFRCADNSAAAEVVASRTREGDGVLLKASRGMRFEEIVEQLGTSMGE